ncbi:Tfp pilus assembly protein PilW [Variovorax sp. PBS-H4]|uniref:PilW family protein n=1 Tax=Variovorax sp. PBS-H4 TaxID=434008 RepID=UPI001315E33E|nr:PilW family protein [Variovorax sp. PBS-H4]VTU41089.1 Tfp pilus assembly protein PilW [Variovorax sp. PBS-H4]
MNASISTSRPLQRGLTLIELLVAMTIGLIVTLAVTSVVTVGEAHKRTTTSTNDMSQSGAFAAYVLDGVLRSAGSGFVQSGSLGVYGCKLSVSRDIGGTATTILPRSSAFPAPFASFLGGAGASAAGDLRVAPVLIGQGQSATGSDVLMVMGGNGAAGDIPRKIRSGVTGTNNLRLENTIGLASGDLGLVAQDGTADCLIEQVNVTDTTAFAAAGNEVLPLGGRYFTSAGGTTSLATLAASGTAYYTPLGNTLSNNVRFQLIGVGANQTLFAYDLLRSAGTGSDADALQAISDVVVELRALYGVDTNGDGIINDWVAPSGTTYGITNLMTTPATIRQIVAVRIALVMRSSELNKETVSPASLTLFSDLATALQRSVTLDQHYRYRVIDTTIPLRNMLLQSAS